MKIRPTPETVAPPRPPAVAAPRAPRALPRMAFNVPRAVPGDPIPLCFGNAGLPGVLIWQSPVTLIDGEPHVSMAWGFGMNGNGDPVDYELAKLFANGRVIWEAGQDNLMSGDLTITRYQGTETQEADPVIAAVEGSDRTPGFRGMFYVVFSDINLTEFDKQIPAISAELEGEAVATSPSDIWILTYAWNAWTDEGALSQFSNCLGRIILNSDEPAIDGTQITNNSNPPGGGPYLYKSGFQSSGSPSSHPPNPFVESFYIDVAAIRADYPDASLDFDFRLQIFPQADDVHVDWSIAKYNGGTVSITGQQYSSSGTLVDLENGSFDDLFGSGTGLQIINRPEEATATGETITPPDTTLITFIERAAIYAGLDPDEDLDIDEDIERTITGAILHEDETFADLLVRLARAYGFIFFEADKIRIVKRVVGSAYTVDFDVPADELDEQGDYGVMTTRPGADESPLELRLGFVDPSLMPQYGQRFDYNERAARRILFPERAAHGDRTEAFAVPVVMTPEDAAELVGLALFREAEERIQHAASLPPEYLKAEPGDVVRVPEGNDLIDAMADEIEIGSDFEVSFRAVNLMTDEDLS
jgi:hypothetical protein